jgi:hypothetical protein
MAHIPFVFKGRVDIFSRMVGFFIIVVKEMAVQRGAPASIVTVVVGNDATNGEVAMVMGLGTVPSIVVMGSTVSTTTDGLASKAVADIESFMVPGSVFFIAPSLSIYSKSPTQEEIKFDGSSITCDLHNASVTSFLACVIRVRWSFSDGDVVTLKG